MVTSLRRSLPLSRDYHLLILPTAPQKNTSTNTMTSLPIPIPIPIPILIPIPIPIFIPITSTPSPKLSLELIKRRFAAHELSPALDVQDGDLVGTRTSLSLILLLQLSTSSIPLSPNPSSHILPHLRLCRCIPLQKSSSAIRSINIREAITRLIL